jgi:cell division protein FtsA
MQPSDNVITAIDVGTTKVCTIVAHKVNSQTPEIVAHSIVPCSGLKKGNVEDLSLTSQAIKESLYEVRNKTNLPIRSAYVGITGAHIAFNNKVDYFDSIGGEGVITATEVGNIPDMVAHEAMSHGRKVIHAVPMTYRVDGQNGLNNPIGMHASGVEVNSHVVTAGSTFVKDLESAVASSGLQVKAMVLEPLASSEAVLTNRERERGSAIIDIGGGTTDIVAFTKGTISYTSVIPVGGYQFTNDIRLTYNTTYQEAENAKLKYASTEPSTVDMSEEIQLGVTGTDTYASVHRRDMCQLMRERTMELIRLIDLKLQQSGVRQNPNAQIVMTGGASTMPGLFDMAQQYIPNCSMRIGTPTRLVGMPEELEGPAFSTGIGIILYGYQQELASERELSTRSRRIGNNVTLLEKITRLFRN